MQDVGTQPHRGFLLLAMGDAHGKMFIIKQVAPRAIVIMGHHVHGALIQCYDWITMYAHSDRTPA